METESAGIRRGGRAAAAREQPGRGEDSGPRAQRSHRVRLRPRPSAGRPGRPRAASLVSSDDGLEPQSRQHRRRAAGSAPRFRRAARPPPAGSAGRAATRPPCADRHRRRRPSRSPGSFAPRPGSWMTTGTTSQPRPCRREPRLRRTAARGSPRAGRRSSRPAARRGAGRRNSERALEAVVGRVERGPSSPGGRSPATSRLRRPGGIQCGLPPRPAAPPKSSAPTSARAATALAAITSTAARSASGFESHGSDAVGRGPSPAGGRRRSRRAAPRRQRGRARRTRRRPVAAERRADANQSIVETGSPGS